MQQEVPTGMAFCYGCGRVYPAMGGAYCESCDSGRPATKADIKRLEEKIVAMLKQSAQKGEK